MDRSRARVLVVDDMSALRHAVRRVLREGGFSAIDEAEDGEAALVLLRSASYDLVITDLRMPNLDGVGLVRALRRLPEGGQTPVLALSGSGLDDALEAGATAALAKPFLSADLLDNVLELLATVLAGEEPLRVAGPAHA
jgi:two-component system chemotaxis response regulator CheY